MGILGSLRGAPSDRNGNCAFRSVLDTMKQHAGRTLQDLAVSIN